jgi:hypothetical protein
LYRFERLLWTNASQATYVSQDSGETPNDRNDRAIRMAAKWYMQRVPAMEVVLLTEDAKNRTMAAALNLKVLSVEQYAKEKITDSALLDQIAWCVMNAFLSRLIQSRESVEELLRSVAGTLAPLPRAASDLSACPDADNQGT